VIVQRLGAKMYSDGIRHSLICRISFEDQRSGETLGKLQKVRSDVERFIPRDHCAFYFSRWHRVCDGHASVHCRLRPRFLVTVPLLGIISSY